MKNQCVEIQQNEAIGRYGQVTGTHNEKWIKTSLLKFAQDSTSWFTTAIYRDNELQNLPGNQYTSEFYAAIYGTENNFIKYIRFTDPQIVCNKNDQSE